MSMLTLLEMHPPKNKEEDILLRPLIDTLWSRKWISDRSLTRVEFAWNGRRIDLATFSVAGTAAAYELKLGAFGRALEQASYNRLAFDRSWVVLGSRPRPAGLAEAADLGVGVMVLEDRMRILLHARSQPRNLVIRKRLLSQFRSKVN